MPCSGARSRVIREDAATMVPFLLFPFYDSREFPPRVTQPGVALEAEACHRLSLSSTLEAGDSHSSQK